MYRPAFFHRLIAVLALLGWLAMAPAYAANAAAQAAPSESTEPELLPITEAYKLSADASTSGVLKLHWAIAPDYYLYRGQMKFAGGPGVTLGEAMLPAGKRHRDEYLGEVETYHGSIDATVPYTLAPGTTRLKLAVRFQGCHEVDPKVCYPPYTQSLDLPLPTAAANTAAGAMDTSTAPASSFGAALGRLGGQSSAPAGTDAAPLTAQAAFTFEALATDAHHLLLRWTMPPGYYLYRDQTALRLLDASGLTLGQPEWPPGTPHEDEHYGKVTVFFGQIDVPVAVTGEAARLRLEATFQGCQEGGICYPKMTRTLDIALAPGGTSAAAPVQAAPTAMGETPPPRQQISLLAALGLALLGGLVLNLMPCVLPVLSLKAVSLLESGESPQHRRRHALFYTAGVLVSFVALGMAIVWLSASWGVQLQQPMVVAALALVMLALGLSMSGLVQFGAGLGNTGAGLASRAGPVGDFFTGVLAVVVASPCTAPFMGSALAFALVAPKVSALLVFLMLGVGLALPFALIGLVPALARWLPRPGRWMETLKQVLAFPMYLTAVWLAWVLAKQRGADAIGLLLVAAVLLAMTLWWFERSRSEAKRALALVLALLTAVPLVLLARVPPPAAAAASKAGVVAYSPERLAALRASGRPVFVDMTADWCVTCKANEHAVLDTAAFRDLLKRTGTVYMQGDWTDVNPTIEAFLKQYHSPGVPLYVVFPSGGGEGKQLSTVLTGGLVERALTKAARQP